MSAELPNLRPHGWAWPLNAPKAHYFYKNAISLCGRWMFTGPTEDSNTTSPDDCKKCANLKVREVDKVENA
jgi:hypothetical protein